MLLGVEQLVVGLVFSGLGHGGAVAEAGGAGEDQQDEGGLWVSREVKETVVTPFTVTRVRVAFPPHSPAAKTLGH